MFSSIPEYLLKNTNAESGPEFEFHSKKLCIDTSLATVHKLPVESLYVFQLPFLLIMRSFLQLNKSFMKVMKRIETNAPVMAGAFQVCYSRDVYCIGNSKTTIFNTAISLPRKKHSHKF